MKRILACAIMGAVALWLALLLGSPHAREQYPGQYSVQPKEVQEWFRSQRNPNNGVYCCDEADGVYAEEDIRHDRYWVRFDACNLATGCTKTGWIAVPPEAVRPEQERRSRCLVVYREQSVQDTLLCAGSRHLREGNSELRVCCHRYF